MGRKGAVAASSLTAGDLCKYKQRNSDNSTGFTAFQIELIADN